MSNKNTDSIKEKAVQAMLTLAAGRGWEGLSLQAIAVEADLPLADLRLIVGGTHDLLAEYARKVDRETLASSGRADENANPRDRLFDLLMERFDILNRDRAGVIALLNGLPCHLGHAVFGLPALHCSMKWMLEGAGIETSGLRGSLRIAVLSALYLHTLREWISDESEDMSVTMAALDKNLGRIEEWARTFRVA
jgi:hypothetical protein